MNRLSKLLLLLALAAFLLALVCAGTLYVISGGQPVDYVQTNLIRLSLSTRTDDLNRAAGSDTTPVRFTVNPGDSPRAIASRLFEMGLILDQQLFVDYVRAYDIDVQLEAGTYFLNKTQTIPVIAETLTDSRNSFIPFRILEGWRMEEIAEVIDRNPMFGFTGEDFLAVVGRGATVDPDFAEQVGLPPGASLEGFLFPNTYQLPPDITPAMLRDTLIDEFLSQVGSSAFVQAEQQGLTFYEVVTLASIVQREAVHREEDPMIASVYRNRLDINMKLDADPTVQYGLGTPGNWWPRITQNDYTTTISPYNTYLNEGLPPGPIANPGLSAIRAALDPADTEYYYFQADCNGSGYHNFTRTYAEHLANSCF